MSNTNRRRSIGAVLGLLGVIAVLSGLLVASAGAQETHIELQAFSDDYPDAPFDEGHEIDLGTIPAPVAGNVCLMTFTSDNNESVWPGNDLLVTTAGETIVLSGVEDSPGEVTRAERSSAIGPTVSVVLRLGPDGFFSLSGQLDFELCAPAPTTTTTTTTTVRVSPSSIPPSSTVAPTTLAPATTTTTKVLGQVQVAPPAQPTPSQPSFTG